MLFVEEKLVNVIDTAAARPTMQNRAQCLQIGLRARSHDLDLALFGIAHPATQIERRGLPLHEPPEADALHPAANEEM